MIGQTKPYVSPWICWAIPAFMYCLQYGLLIFPETFAQVLEKSLAIDTTQVGLFSSAYLYTYVVMQIPAGLLFDKFSTRTILVSSALLLVFGCITLAYSPNFTCVIFSRMIMGLGASTSFVGAIYIGKNYFESRLFPLIVGLTEAMSGISSLAIGSFFAFSQKFQNWRLTILEIALPLAILAFLGWRYIGDKPNLNGQDISCEKTSIKHIFSHKGLWLLGLFAGLIFAHFTVIENMWGIPYLKIHYHLHTESAVLENSMVVLGLIVGTISCGFLTRYFSEKKLLFYCVVAVFVLFIIIYYFPINLLFNSILLFVLGLTTGSIVLCFTIAEKIVPKHSQGIAAGFINMFFGGIGIPMIPLVGFLIQRTGKNYHLAVLPIAFTSLLAIVISYLLLFYKDSK